MKTKIFNLTIGLILMTSLSLFAQELKTEKFKVLGSCGMCETRIEKTVKGLDGVTKADWNLETNMLEVTFDKSKIKVDDIHKAVARVGHDTEKYKADDKVYEALPACCHYRK